MRLSKALRLKPGLAVAFVGAGGKSSAIRRILREVSSDEGDEFEFTLITTTTRLGQEQKDLAKHHLIDPDPDQIEALPELLKEHRSLLVTGPDLEGKWIPPKESVIAELHQKALQVGALMLIEADGARSRSLKAPEKHEPVIPEFVELVVPVAGLDVLGQTTRSEAVHRPERVESLVRGRKGSAIGPTGLAAVMSSDKGGLQRVPEGAEVRILLNKTTDSLIEAGREIAKRLLRKPRIQSVVLASVMEEDPVREVHGRVAGVILAAGGSSRLGEPKQLIQWRKHPLIWHAVRAAGGLDSVTVVIGEQAGDLRRALKKAPVQIVENPDWEVGQSSSVRVGLAAVPAGAEAVVFLLADMPFVGPDLVEALIERYRRSMAPLVATRAGGRRANPVLFDRETFSDLRALRGDEGGRAIFERFERQFVEWDDSVLLDVDTPEDLERLRSME